MVTASARTAFDCQAKVPIHGQVTVSRLSPNFMFHENVNFEERVRYQKSLQSIRARNFEGIEAYLKWIREIIHGEHTVHSDHTVSIACRL